MPLIIAATDFSDVATNAVKYACGLASAHGAGVIIMHTFIVPVMFSDIPMPMSLMNDAQNDAEAQMAKLTEEMAGEYPAISVSGKVIYGDTVGAIEEYAVSNHRPWLVVMGNSSTAENNTWPDSVLIDAFKKLRFPVLGIPPDAAFTKVKKLCLAYDNKHSGNDTALQQTTDITRRLNATLHVLNVQQDVHNQDNNQYLDINAEKILGPLNPHYHFTYEAANINSAIEDFVQSNDIDWLIMIPHKHSFFEGMFHKSHTRAVAQHTHIPILALHEKN